jgi:hypothetical protein
MVAALVPVADLWVPSLTFARLPARFAHLFQGARTVALQHIDNDQSNADAGPVQQRAIAILGLSHAVVPAHAGSLPTWVTSLPPGQTGQRAEHLDAARQAAKFRPGLPRQGVTFRSNSVAPMAANVCLDWR